MAVMSFGQLIRRLASSDPHRLAITCGDRCITRHQLDRTTNRLARAYALHGVQPGDLVTVALPNSIEFFESCIALWKLGATPQPVAAGLPDAELETVVALARPKLVIGTEARSDEIGLTLPQGFAADRRLLDDALSDTTSRYWKATCSGGSTGRPKIIVSHTRGELDPDVHTYHRMLPDRVHLVPGPLYHNGPFTLAMLALLRGNHVVVMTKFDAREVLDLVDRFQVDWVFLVPTMMSRIVKLAPSCRSSFDVSSLRIVFHSAADCPVWLKREWINWLGPERIIEFYGGTEGIGSTCITGTEWLKHPGSVGRALPGYNIKVVGPDGATLPAGTVGDVYCLPGSGPGSTYHYLGAEPNPRIDGWETLGDIGYFDADGYLYLCDRKIDVIICGGAKIYPAEVEAAIDAHPDVRSSAVVGLSHEDLGQVAHAIVETAAPMTSESLKDYLSDRLVRYKIPRSYEFADRPVRDDAGKVRRTALAKARSIDI
jgi:bile acid-coenzyme A ligase